MSSSSYSTSSSDDSCSAQDRVEQAYRLAQPVGTAYSIFSLVGKGLVRGGVDFMLDAIVESSGTGDDRYLLDGQQALEEAGGKLLGDDIYTENKVGGCCLPGLAAACPGWLLLARAGCCCPGWLPLASAGCPSPNTRAVPPVLQKRFDKVIGQGPTYALGVEVNDNGIQDLLIGYATWVSLPACPALPLGPVVATGRLQHAASIVARRCPLARCRASSRAPWTARRRCTAASSTWRPPC